MDRGAWQLPELTTCSSSRCHCKGVTAVRIAFYGWMDGSQIVADGLIGDLLAAAHPGHQILGDHVRKPVPNG